MENRTLKILLALALVLILSLPLIALGDAIPQSANSMMAASPVSSYTAGVMLYMLLVGFLVTFLLGGGFAVVNLGLMSKRAEDSRRGHWDPSDVAFINEPHSQQILPAEEGEIEDPYTLAETRLEWAEGAMLVTEDQMIYEGKRAA